MTKSNNLLHGTFPILSKDIPLLRYWLKSIRIDSASCLLFIGYFGDFYCFCFCISSIYDDYLYMKTLLYMRLTEIFDPIILY